MTKSQMSQRVKESKSQMSQRDKESKSQMSQTTATDPVVNCS